VASQLVTGPKVLVLDEPTSGLDSVGGWEVVRFLRAVARREGVSLLFFLFLMFVCLWVGGWLYRYTYLPATTTPSPPFFLFFPPLTHQHTTHRPNANSRVS
jgi:hypothetical protein